jgi:drug/metabolite transporter (DMT)-like permease
MTPMGEKRSGRAFGASGLLVLAATIWGLAFVAQRVGMDHVGPFLFNGARFLLGVLVLMPFLLYRSRRHRGGEPHRAPRPRIDRATWFGLITAGLVLTIAANLQQVGLVTTTAGKAGFLTGLYVVIVPLLGLFRGQRVRWAMAAAVPLSAAGLYLLSVIGPLRLAPGDGWVLLGALVWAVHVQVIDWLVERADALVIAVVQFSICGTLSLAASLAFETTMLAGLAAAAGSIAYAGILSVGVAYTLQIVGQRLVEPSRAGVLLSLEAVFAALGGWVVLGERLALRSLVGCGLMLAAMILAQFGARRRRLEP